MAAMSASAAVSVQVPRSAPSTSISPWGTPLRNVGILVIQLVAAVPPGGVSDTFSA